MSVARFEFDSAKSVANMEKHGIDFHQARQLWQDPDRTEIPAHDRVEPRSLVIGRIAGTHWSAVITYRGNYIRLISVRRSRRQEIELYESDG